MERSIPLLMRMQSSHYRLSPLQAEFETLIWAIECLITALKTNIGFASACYDLISTIDNPSSGRHLGLRYNNLGC